MLILFIFDSIFNRAKVWETWIMPFLGGLQGLGQLSILRRDMARHGAMRQFPATEPGRHGPPVASCCIICCILRQVAAVVAQRAEFNLTQQRTTLTIQIGQRTGNKNLRGMPRHYSDGQVDASISAAANDSQRLDPRYSGEYIQAWNFDCPAQKVLAMSNCILFILNVELLE
jgi:hypothetical protein